MSTQYENDAWKEQAALEAKARRDKETRLCDAARKDDEATLLQLGERFGWTTHKVGRILRANGIDTKQRQDGFGAQWNVTHRRSRHG
jgi:hypothetical protein